MRLSIAYTNTKPGTGKTTTSVLVAQRLHDLGHDVLLVDADPAQSALAWSDDIGGFDFKIVGLATRDAGRRLADFAGDDTIVLVDLPQAEDHGAIVRSVLRHVDEITIPVAPSTIEIDRTGAITDLLDEVAEVRVRPARVRRASTGWAPAAEPRGVPARAWARWDTTCWPHRSRVGRPTPWPTGPHPRCRWATPSRCWPRSTCTGPGSGWGCERCEIVLVGVPVRPGRCVPPHLPGGVESGAWPHGGAVQAVADHGGPVPGRPPAPASYRRPARRGVGRAGGVAPGGVAGAAGRAGRRRCSVCA